MLLITGLGCAPDEPVVKAPVTMPYHGDCTVERTVTPADTGSAEVTTIRYDAEERAVSVRWVTDARSTLQTTTYDADGCLTDQTYDPDTASEVEPTTWMHATCDAHQNPVHAEGQRPTGSAFSTEYTWTYTDDLPTHMVSVTTADGLTRTFEERYTWEGENRTQTNKWDNGTLVSTLAWTYDGDLLLSETMNQYEAQLLLRTTWEYDTDGRPTMEHHEDEIGVDVLESDIRWTWFPAMFHISSEQVDGNGGAGAAPRTNWSCTDDFPWTCTGIAYESDDPVAAPIEQTVEAWTCD